MTTYTPPVDDIRFVMHQVADLAGILATERFAHVDADTVDAVVEEVGRFMAEEVAPTNVDGDRIGSQWQPDGPGVTPPSFRPVYDKWVASGFGAMPFDPEFGGAGFPWITAIAVQEVFTSANMAAATEWRCRKCTPTRHREEGMPPPQCLLCPARTGPLCPTADGNWTHVPCATRVDNVSVSFATNKRVDPTIDVSEVWSSLAAKRCTVCRIKTGACITCGHGGCPKVFHVTCALHQGFRHVYRAADDTAGEDVKPRVFCRLHS